MRTLAVLRALSLSLLLVRCVPTPTEPEQLVLTTTPGGVYVLCEGLWQQDNATLSYLDPNGSVVRSAVPNLGDTPTDMVVKGDTIIVCVNTSRSLLMIDRRTAQVLQRTSIGTREQPYRMALFGDRLYVTGMNADGIIEFDARTLQRTTQTVPVGPAPDGIAATASKVYVAISGLGDLRRTEPGAGTLKILRRSDLTEITTISDVPNAGSVVADGARNHVWVAYRQVPSDTARGGVVLLHARTDTVIHRFAMKTPTRIEVDPATGDAYVLCDEGVVRCTADGSMQTVVQRTGSDVWYSLWIRPTTREVYVGNARQYVTDGEVLVYSLSGQLLRRSAVGLNPTAFVE